MNLKELKILVADDHSIVRKGIINSLVTIFPNVITGEAANAAEVLHIMNHDQWDLVILDISMPGRSGLEVLRDIKTGYPKVPVIIFSMYPEDQFAVRAIKAGASAYLSKDVSSKELEKAIKGILQGDHFFTPSVAALLTSELQNNKHNKAVHETLSDREYQVFQLISKGKGVSDIAEELNLSVKTISVYRSIILKKMNLKNNSEMMYYAFKNNLVS
ncbi:MAG TPA: response regulator transcription factor [Draconibacterium sp.]|nr:response regulator transcription factor [Draconibacterium sp.]